MENKIFPDQTVEILFEPCLVFPILQGEATLWVFP